MKKYRTKISIRLIIVLFITLIVVPIASNLLLGDFHFQWIHLVLFSVIFAITIYFVGNTFYIIEGKELKIKIGFVRVKTIPIESIRKIVKITSIVSAPASSFDRIEIKNNKYDEIVISPKYKKQFIDDLLEINSEIIVAI